jgi:hypothetical protein
VTLGDRPAAGRPALLVARAHTLPPVRAPHRAQLRELSGGKPIGFKLCVGRPDELLALAHAMVETRITPDFITVDGAEGGTGAAPVEFSNSIGMPLVEVRGDLGLCPTWAPRPSQPRAARTRALAHDLCRDRYRPRPARRARSRRA